jgi:hypothetical protein
MKAATAKATPEEIIPAVPAPTEAEQATKAAPMPREYLLTAAEQSTIIQLHQAATNATAHLQGALNFLALTHGIGQGSLSADFTRITAH